MILVSDLIVLGVLIRFGLLCVSADGADEAERTDALADVFAGRLAGSLTG